MKRPAGVLPMYAPSCETRCSADEAMMSVIVHGMQLSMQMCSVSQEFLAQLALLPVDKVVCLQPLRGGTASLNICLSCIDW